MRNFWNSPSPEPKIIAETPLYLVVYKPPGIHTAPLAGEDEGTLLSWVAASYPDVLAPRGRLGREGGLLHRLDYETRGLVLIARTQAALEALLCRQEQDRIVKEYTALSAGGGEAPPGFPPFPAAGFFSFSAEAGTEQLRVIESGFRPYGRGRKMVRPVLPGPGQTLYQTGILFWTADNRDPGPPGEGGPWGFLPGPGRIFRLRISRGYRHQIRSHLAWAGWPIVNDPLYGGAAVSAVPGLALSAEVISFTDPETGRRVRYRLDY
ncbi:MAG: RNA pseudouridine synthase [Spirochaetaceae bacterium]|jgi:23S rRNA pseudouridine1911/1915/1917 synthase|nr:RNA pseudouridine synthase [Spirochaetaceae bacterium]